MKNIKAAVTAMNKPMATADTKNKAGGKAWTPTDSTLLMQYAMTGTLGNTFYASSNDIIKEAVQLLECANAADLADAIVIGREKGFIRSFNILGLVYLSSKNAPDLFKATFPRVIKTGGDLKDFIDLVNARRGFGRSIKTAIHTWLKANINVYYAQKYRGDLADAIRISRFKSEQDFEHAELVNYVLSKYDNVKGNTPDKVKAALDKYPELAAKDQFIAYVNDGKLEPALALMKQFNFEVDSLTMVYDKFDKAIWKEIAKNTPTMKFLKFLNKFIDAGALTSDRASMELLEKKINVEALAKAKVFPFRLATAFKVLQNECVINTSKIKMDVVNHLAEVLDKYAQAFNWEKFNEFNWYICPDVSGSMTSNVYSDTTGKKMTTLSPAVISGLLNGCFMKGLKTVTCLPWAYQVQSYNVPKSYPIMEHIKAIEAANGGGTHMEAALTHMIQKLYFKDFRSEYYNGQRNCYVFITDSMEYGSGWLNSWVELKKHDSTAVAFVVRIDSYSTQPMSDEQAKKYDIHQIFGWTDSVFEYMRFVLNALKK